MLTGLIGRPDRLIYLTADCIMQVTVPPDIDWASRSWNAAQAYSESKLQPGTILRRCIRTVAGSVIGAAGTSPQASETDRGTARWPVHELFRLSLTVEE